MKRLIGALIAVAALVACGGTVSSAALQLPEGIEEQLSLDITPRVPGPNESVSITVRSFSTNLAGAEIAWYVNGSLASSGRGVTSFSTIIGDVGTETKVSLRIIKAEGGELARDLTFAPADLEMVFEPLTYTPPFYQGRSVYTHQAPYKVVAIPRFVGADGTRYGEKDLVYTWRINGRNVEGAGGFGKNVLMTKGALISRPFDVTVEAQTPDGSIGAKEILFVEPSQAELLFYEKDPLYGTLYNRALEDEVDMGTQKEMTIAAVPMYFGITRPDDTEMSYDWRIDDVVVIMARNENELTLRVPDGEGVSGTNMVTLQARHMTDLLQAGYDAMTVEFGVDR